MFNFDNSDIIIVARELCSETTNFIRLLQYDRW